MRQLLEHHRIRKTGPVGNKKEEAAAARMESCRLVLDAAGASNASQAVVWIPSPPQQRTTEEASAALSPPSPPLLVYASHSVLHLARRREHTLVVGLGDDDKNDNGDDAERSSSRSSSHCFHLWERSASLRANGLDATAPEVITSLATVQPPFPPPPTISHSGSSLDADRRRPHIPTTAVVCGFSSGRILVWIHHGGSRDNFESSASSKGEVKEEEWQDAWVVGDPKGRSVTALDALWIEDTTTTTTATLVVLSGSSAGAFAHECRFLCDNARDKGHSWLLDGVSTVHLTETPVASALLRHQIGDVLCCVGTAAPRHNLIRVWSRSVENFQSSALQKGHHSDAGAAVLGYSYIGALSGHEDWVACLDWKALATPAAPPPLRGGAPTAAGAAWLASGGQDCRIRLWRWSVHPRALEPKPTGCPHSAADDATDDSNDDDDGPLAEEDDFNVGESRLEVVHSDGTTESNVFLEAILLGHEAAITSVQWHPDPVGLYGTDLVLLSASMDRTILLWAPIRPSTGDGDAIWTPLPRLGVAGGILGGPVGASLLGWCRAMWEPGTGRAIVGHAYGGALHAWSLDESDVDSVNAQIQRTGQAVDADSPPSSGQAATGGTAEERIARLRWNTTPGLTGHFRGVTDLCWEASTGAYLVSVGRDQTCRLWAPLRTRPVGGGLDGREDKNSDPAVWVELARPQVHGYDLMAVASLSTPHRPHRLVTAADEKELRVFDAPLRTLRELESLCGIRVGEASGPSVDVTSRVERAYIPSLGLTNKSSAGDGAEEDESDALFETSKDETLRVPLERDLGVASVWPESNKLFGHKSELFALTATLSSNAVLDQSFTSPRGSVMLASSTKARDAEAATIRLWDVESGKCIQALSSHKSTVSAMSFSASGQYLVSSGKDRRLSLWARQCVDLDYSPFELVWVKDSAHKRIVWSVHFHPCDETVFASGSRDGSVKVWRIQKTFVFQVRLLQSFAPMYGAAECRPCAVTALSFAPTSDPKSGHLALGLDVGLLEVWVIPLGDEGGPAVNSRLVPPSLCHNAAVNKLAWRPNAENGVDATLVYLASCSVDHGVRVFEFKLKATI